MVLEPNTQEGLDSLPQMARLVKLITEIGPDIDLIARISREYKETVRYRYREKILGKGMAVQAVPNEAALGMVRVTARVRVAGAFLPHIQPIFWAMSDLSYACAYELAVPEGDYVLHASVPNQFVSDYKSFIFKLKEMGIFDSIEIYQFSWYRRSPMRAEYYDFNEGRWDYDWQTPIPLERGDMEPKQQGEVKFDRTDLLILKELQLDANQSLTEIRQALMNKNKMDINYKTMAWHYRNHVVKGGLINSYSIRWPGTKYNQAAEKAEQKRHTYIGMNLIVKDVSESEVLDLTGRMHQTPFLWSEMGGKDYFAQCAFPVESAMEAFDYLRKVMHAYAGRAIHYVVDQRNSITFVVPFGLWDEAEKAWKFDKEGTLARFENLVLTVRNGTGSGT